MGNRSFVMYRDRYMVIEMRGAVVGSAQDTIPLQQYREAVADYIHECQGKQIMPRIIIDLGKVTYLNSNGIGTLVAMHSDVRRAKGKIVFADIGKVIANVFVVTKLNQIFDMASMAEAEQKIEQ